MTGFATLGLDARLLKAVNDLGYTDMSPIQEQAIPHVLQGRDVMGSAQTGTGKTAAFSLPLLQRLLKHETDSASPARHPVRAIVLTPTRELASQVSDSLEKYASNVKLRTTVVYGGTDIRPQIQKLREGIEIVTATPGRLLDHINGKTIFLQHVEYVVLDEADRMLDIGFLPDLQRILSHLPKKRTTLLFSATFSEPIKKLAASYLQNPILVEVARPNETAATVEERFLAVGDRQKYAALREQFQQLPEKQAFVFLNSKAGCGRLLRMLERDGIRAATLHGDKSQAQREQALQAFKQGEVDLLVATDVAARGLDIKDVPAVFNYDIPFNPEDYVHRIGRTGRAGADGLAVSLVTGEDSKLISGIEKLRKVRIQPTDYAPARTAGSSRSDGRSGNRSSDRHSHSSDRSRRSDSQSDSGSRRSSGSSGRRGGSRHTARSNNADTFWEQAGRSGENIYRPKPKVVNDPIFDQPYTPQTEDSRGGTPAASAGKNAPAPGTAPGRRRKTRAGTAALFQKARTGSRNGRARNDRSQGSSKDTADSSTAGTGNTAETPDTSADS